jgi:signal transduction histidine kinase
MITQPPGRDSRALGRHTGKPGVTDQTRLYGQSAKCPLDRSPPPYASIVGTAVPKLSGQAHRGSILVADGLLVLLVTALALSTLLYRAFQGPEVPGSSVRFDAANAIAVVLMLAGVGSLVWRRPAALPLLIISGATSIVLAVLGSASLLLPFAPLMALYAVAANYSPSISGSAAGVLATGAFFLSLANPGPFDDDFIDYLLSVGTAWLLGYGVRLNRARTSLLDDQARQFTREQAVKTREAVEQEKTRIARELHDIVAHHVVVMVAQAGAAKRVVDDDCDRARRALDSIETLGREALTEMRRLLGMLWADDGASRTPQPRLEELPALVAQIKRAGLPVRLTIHGSPRPLPAGVELNAYRIIQEALTNTLKHAGPTRAEVEIVYDEDFLQLRISDEGRGTAKNVTPGHGVVSMGQRAMLLGGEIAVGPGPAGGFQVKAVLPLDGDGS